MNGRDSRDDAYWQGYERGVESGRAAGYQEGVHVLDGAADALAAQKPWRILDRVFARQRLATSGPSRSPQEIRTQAALSWGLPVPADLSASATGQSAEAIAEQDTAARSPVAAADVAELADDDDWAWQL